MWIIVISLARATDRRQAMRQRLAELGLLFEFLDATDGRALTAEQKDMADNERRRWRFRRPLTENEIACFISHRNAMAKLVASNVPMAAVLEDDVTFSSELPRILHALAGQNLKFDVIDLTRAKGPEVFVPCRPLVPDLWLGRTGYHTGAFGYVISRDGAQRFLRQTGRFVDEVDRELHRYWVNGLDLYGLEYPVVFHDDMGVSMIDETRGDAADYPDANSWHLVLRRNGYRLYNSFWKRIAFPAYVLRGQLLDPSNRRAIAGISTQLEA